MSCNNQQYYLFQNKGKSKHAAHQLQVRFYTGKSLMENRIVYIENEQLFTESEAIVRILSRIGGVWKPLAAMLSFIPRKWRDYLYRLIAKHRYRIFGKKKQCYITPIKYADRFVPEIDMEKIKAIKSKG